MDDNSRYILCRDDCSSYFFKTEDEAEAYAEQNCNREIVVIAKIIWRGTPKLDWTEVE